MSGEFNIAEEDIYIEPKLMEQSFQRGLKTGKLVYLDELKKHALVDDALQSKRAQIDQAFTQMRYHIGKQTQLTSHNLTRLSDFLMFGLDYEQVDRIGYLAFQLDSVSPILRKRSSRSVQHGFTRSPSVQSEENYDDDFEEMDENDFGQDEDVEEEDEAVTDTSKEINVLKNRFQYHSVNPTTPQSTAGGSNLNPIASKNKLSPVGEVSTEDSVATLRNNFVGGSNPSPTKEKAGNQFRGFSQQPQQQQQPVPSPSAANPFAAPSRPGLLKPQTAVSVDISNIRTNNNNNNVAPSSSSVVGPPEGNAVSMSTKKRTKATPSWITNREWRLGDKIGSGSFGEVFQAMNNKGKLFAAKRMNIIDKSHEVENLLAEIQLMRGLSHKHIVEYLGTYVDSKECYLYIFQEWVPGGSVAHLLKKFGPFSVSVVRNYTHQILLGLQYLHANNIVHRDIKGGNILVDDNGVVKLADFGASTELNDFGKTQETNTIKGTPYFMAPEVIASSKYGRKGDIWAVGCTMVQMLTGDPPWKEKNLRTLVQLHLVWSNWNGPPPMKNVVVPPDCQECLELCFRKNENDRPNATELLECAFILSNEDLEESFDRSIYRRSSSRYDALEDSGVMAGLKNEISRAVAQSQSNLHLGVNNSNGNGNGNGSNNTDDTFADIERKMRARQQGQAAPEVHNANNPFSRDNSPRASTNTGKNSPSATGGGADILSPQGTRVAQVVNNPFGRASTNANPNAKVASVAPPAAGVSKPVPVYPLDLKNNVKAAGPSNNTSPRDGIVESDAQIRESIHMIKKKATERASNSPRINVANRYSQGGNNLSSNRDSEDITPLPAEDNYHAYQGNIRSGGAHSRHESFDSTEEERTTSRIHPMTRYDTRYFEEKQKDDESDQYVSLSQYTGPKLTSRPVLQRNETIESVEDAVENNYYRDVHPEMAPAVRKDKEEVMYHMHSNSAFNKPVQNVLRRENRRYGQEPEDATNKSGSTLGMKKSASAADSIGVGGAVRKNAVPKLTTVEHSTTDRAHPASIGGKSASARYPQVHTEGQEAVSRPYTSRAALGQPKPAMGMARDSSKSMLKQATHQAARLNPPPSIGAEEAGSDPEEPWRCLRCKIVNPGHLPGCDKCGTIRGSTGRRDPDAPLVRR